MQDYAGYAAAIAIRAPVFDDALLREWHGGRIKSSIDKTIDDGSIVSVKANLFVGPPHVKFVSFNRVDGILRLDGWGRLTRGVVFASETRAVTWRAELRITPAATSVGSIALLTAQKADYLLIKWEFDVLDGTPFSAEDHAYFTGAAFKDELLEPLRDAIGNLSFPVVDFRFLGPFGGVSFSSIDLQCVEGALILGFNIDRAGFATSGDPSQLHDFAGQGNDVAVVVNPESLKALMPSAEQQVQEQIDEYDATLERLEIGCEQGRFRITGRASLTGGTANFSVAAVPRMTYSLPGDVISLKKKTMVVGRRTWPAISFAATDAHVDIHRSDWLIVTEVIGGFLTLGFLPFAVEAFISGVSRNITGGINTANYNPEGATPRVRKFGDPPTRFEIQQFQIDPSGVFIGIGFTLAVPRATLGGIRSLPRNFAGRRVAYEVALPFDALETDPFLRIRWTVIDLASGAVLLNQDGIALHRRRFEFTPAALGSGVERFAVVCRVFRVLGPFTTELLNDTIELEIGPALSAGAFIQWRYDVENPQIRYDELAEHWSHVGDKVTRRWSKLHRTDKPCKNVSNASRFIYDRQVLDDLPFQIHDLDRHRQRLCDYCFFGGPASKIAKL